MIKCTTRWQIWHAYLTFTNLPSPSDTRIERNVDNQDLRNVNNSLLGRANSYKRRKQQQY